MKGILEFSLPEEREDFEIAQNGINYKIALEELDNFCRQKLKYESDRHPEAYIQAMQEVRDLICELTSF